MKSDHDRFLAQFSNLQRIEGPMWTGKRPKCPDVEFERKYAGFSSEELNQAKELAVRQFDLARESSLDARYEAGSFETREIVRGQPWHTGLVGAEVPFTRYIRKARSSEVHIVSLPFHEYPEVYYLGDEASWLKHQAHGTH